MSLWSRAVRHIAAGRACSSGSASVTRVLPSAYQTTRLASTSAAAGPSTPPEIRGGGKVRRSPSPKARRHHGDKTGPSSTQNRAVPSDRTDERPESRKRLSGFSKPKSNRRGGNFYNTKQSFAFKLSSASSDPHPRIASAPSTSDGVSSSNQDASHREISASIGSEDTGHGAEVQAEMPDKENGESAAGPSGTNSPPNDQLVTAEERLRAFFAAKTGRPSNTSFKATLAEASEEDSSSTYPIDQGLQLDAITVDDAASQPAASFIEETASPIFSRPKLADLQRAGQGDELVGLYQSDTVWDPSKEYALMPEGPERTSIVAKVLDRAPTQHIMVILDGDNLLFAPQHMNKGYEGGKFVYNELRERIAKKHRLNPKNLDLRIRIFSATNALATVLNKARVMRKDFFFDFLQGIMDSGPYNYVINVGKASQAADIRVKAALADAIRDPRCFRAYLGGLDDYGYIEDLRLIHERGLLESKVNLIQVPGFARDSNVYRAYAHRAIDLDYLFKNNKVALADMQLYVSKSMPTSMMVLMDPD